MVCVCMCVEKERLRENDQPGLDFEILPFLVSVFTCVGFLYFLNATVALKNIDNIILTFNYSRMFLPLWKEENHRKTLILTTDYQGKLSETLSWGHSSIYVDHLFYLKFWRMRTDVQMMT